MKRNKRLKDYKTESEATRSNWGTSPEQVKRRKKHLRRKLRLANKEIED
jgi:hypothetical protein